MNARTPLVELVPRGNRFFVRLLLGGVAIVALLEAAYAATPLLNGRTTDGSVAALDLDGEGSLAVWFSSFTLLAAAVACLPIYVLSGKRRIWLWAAACWTVLSIDECSSLHEAYMHLMTRLTGERLSHDGSLWWVLTYGVLLSATGMMLLRAMRTCIPACVAFLATAGFYGVAVLSELGWITAKDMTGVMLEEGCEMLGNLALLTAMLLFARHLAEQHRRSEPLVRSLRIPARIGENPRSQAPTGNVVTRGSASVHN